MKKVITLSLVTLYLIIGCGKQPIASINSQTIVDSTGIAVSITPLPSRIISCAPVITQDIYLLNGQSKLIGVSKYCKLPAGDKKTIIGDLLSQDIEQIIQLKPDLVLASKEGNNPQPINRLRELGIRVFVLPEANSWTEIQKGFLQIATLFDKTKEAENILSRASGALRRVSKTQDAKHKTPKVFFQLSDQLHTMSKDTFIDEAITYAGGINIAHNALSRWPMFSIEQIIKEDPDLIIISTMGGIEEQAKANWQKFPELKAIKNNKISIIDADICCTPTPENFVKLVEMIVVMLSAPR